MTKQEKQDKDQQPDLSLEELQAKCEKYLQGWQRAKADYQNFKKQTVKDHQAAVAHANQELISQILPLVDNFNQAFAHIPADQKGAQWVLGIGHIRRQLLDWLTQTGVEEIPALNQLFDPHQHESAGTKKSDQHEAGTVIAVLQPGYRLQDRVIRPARVIITE